MTAATKPISGRQGTAPAQLRAINNHERCDRLVAIRKRCDLRNLFRMNHDIVPVSL
jgi:hypothetical protein